jgi:hypothetical protein
LSTSSGDAVPVPTQAPPWHASFVVQTLASSHVVPSGAAGFEQTPVAAAHVPATWHASLAAQTTGECPRHDPPWQSSTVVQAFASSHEAPSGAFGFVQTPVAALHNPTKWQPSIAAHTTGFPPEHVPD